MRKTRKRIGIYIKIFTMDRIPQWMSRGIWMVSLRGCYRGIRWVSVFGIIGIVTVSLYVCKDKVAAAQPEAHCSCHLRIRPALTDATRIYGGGNLGSNPNWLQTRHLWQSSSKGKCQYGSSHRVDDHQAKVELVQRRGVLCNTELRSHLEMRFYLLPWARVPLLSALCYGGMVQCLWELRSVSRFHRWPSLLFQPIDTRMSSPNSQTVIPYLNTTSKQPVKLDLQGPLTVRCLAFWPDGTKLITVVRFEMRIWNVRDGTQEGSPVLLPLSQSVSSIAVSPDGKKFATGGIQKSGETESGKVLLWDAFSHQIHDNFGFLAESDCHSVHFSSDSRLIAFAFRRKKRGSEDIVKVANVADGRTLRVIEASSGTTHALLSPDATHLAACGPPCIQIWDLYSDLPSLKIEQKASSLEWTSDGLCIITHTLGYFKGHITMYDVATGNQIRRWQHEGGLPSELTSKVNPISISLSPSGHLLAGVCRDTLYVWNLETTQVVLRCEVKARFKSGHVSIAYSPKGDFIACDDYLYPIPNEHDTESVGSETLPREAWFVNIIPANNSEISAQERVSHPRILSPLVFGGQTDHNPLGSILDIFSDYVFNELPSYLLSVNDRTLLSREAIRELLRPRIETITEDNIRQQMSQLISSGDPNLGDHWKLAVRKLIKKRLPYAIFSHRWFAIGEPSFKDMTTNVEMAGAGFEKLWMFCNKAKECGCEYVWSDTCCIDKSSSAELEEAIRSMFRWYRNAAVCIAYLSQTSTIDDLAAEEWFTRGWTLQELIAPEKMKFYGKGWIPLAKPRHDGNDKTDLEFMRAISSVTGIPSRDLTHYSPSCSRVYEKMLWAAKRRTTRIEDVAYSLLGMFDVVMPVSYGEGHWAFTRLMQIIIERSHDLSVFAWAGRSSRHSAALPPSPASYLELSSKAAISLQLMRKDTILNGCLTRYDAYRRGDRSFTMTKRGLQIKLLLVDAAMVAPSRCIDGQHLLHYLQQRHPKWTDDHLEDMMFLPKLGSLYHGELAPVRVSGQPFVLTQYNQWALGIVDYLRTMDNKIGELDPGQYMCLLLRRKNPLTSESWDTFEGWEKLETMNVVTLDCVKKAEGRVETVWLWNSALTSM